MESISNARALHILAPPSIHTARGRVPPRPQPPPSRPFTIESIRARVLHIAPPSIALEESQTLINVNLSGAEGLQESEGTDGMRAREESEDAQLSTRGADQGRGDGLWG